ncbi:MAG: FTR1 family iron permease [Thermoleophilia bacterium]
MLTALVITLREGLEAALVVAVVLSFLDRSGESRLKRYAWYGAAVAAGLCIASATLLFSLAESLVGEASEAFEIVVTLLAVSVLTFMIMWMKRHGRNLKSAIEERAKKASGTASATGRVSTSSSALAILTLAFAAVAREGFETVLFLLGSASESGTAATVAGASVGLGAAMVAGLVFYRGVYRLNLKKFFEVTGVMLIVLAAGLVANSVQDLFGSGLLPAALTDPVWNTGAWLSQETGPGAVLHSLLGYQSAPSPVALMSYVLYLGSMLWLYFAPKSGRQRALAEGAH